MIGFDMSESQFSSPGGESSHVDESVLGPHGGEGNYAQLVTFVIKVARLQPLALRLELMIRRQHL